MLKRTIYESRRKAGRTKEIAIIATSQRLLVAVLRIMFWREAQGKREIAGELNFRSIDKKTVLISSMKIIFVGTEVRKSLRFFVRVHSFDGNRCNCIYEKKQLVSMLPNIDVL